MDQEDAPVSAEEGSEAIVDAPAASNVQNLCPVKRYRIKPHEVDVLWSIGDLWVIAGVGGTGVQQQVKKDTFLLAYEEVPDGE